MLILFQLYLDLISGAGVRASAHVVHRVNNLSPILLGGHKHLGQFSQLDSGQLGY